MNQRFLGTASLVGILVFLFVGMTSQLLRPDLNWWRVPMSYYLIGPYGWLLRAAYVAMGASLTMLGIGWYVALSRPTRSAAPLLLFVAASIAVCTTAFQRTDIWGGVPTLEGYIHGVAAMTSFVCITGAAVLLALRLRHSSSLRAWFVPATAYATCCFLGVFILFFARGLPRGVSQKVLILAIMVGLAGAAYGLRKWRPGESAERTHQSRRSILAARQ